MAASLSFPLPKPTQTPCCYTSALDDQATFCDDCGTPLVRCMAAEECRGLLDEQGLCTICVHPVIQVDAGAVSVARVGEAVALPLTLANASVAGRPLFITALWSREGGLGEWREEPLGWERLGPGESRPIKIMARNIEQAGSHTIELRLAVANHWQWRKECYVFKTDFTLTIMPPKETNGPVVNIGGESAGHGNIVYITGGQTQSAASERTDEKVILILSRVEKVERLFAFRGLDDGFYVPRHARLIWSGFAPLEAPLEGPITTRDGLLKVGRNRSAREGGLTDVRLLVEAHDGTLDEALSLTLSRHHFDLYIECDRFMLRVVSENGLRVDGQAYGRDRSVILQDGSVISPLVRTPDVLSLTVSFHQEHKSIRQIKLTRTPASQREFIR